MAASAAMGILNWDFMVRFYLMYTMYNAVLTITIFFQRIYTLNLKMSLLDVVRATAFIGYGKRKKQWGRFV